MTDRDETIITAVLDFWLDEIGPERWFRGGPEVDAAVHDRFGDLSARAVAGGFDRWPETARGALALLILLDQFPRNLHRAQAAAFAGDERARKVAAAGIERGFDLGFDSDARSLFYLPFEHSEAWADQERSLTLFEALTDRPVYLDYAQRHAALIRRFGRYPHRNRALGRADTPDEAAWLDNNAEPF